MRKTYEEFVSYVEENLLGRMPQDQKRSIVIRDVVKNNNITLTSLSMPKEGEVLSPTLYMDYLYEEYYQRGITLGEYLNEISCRYCHAEEKSIYPFSTKMLKKENIICALVPIVNNEEFLRDLPFYPVHENFALIFKFYLETIGDGGSGTILISDSIAQEMGYSLKDLLDCSIQNTSKLFPIKIQSMRDILLDMGLCDEDSIIMEAMNQKEASNLQMYCLTNTENYCGATALIYPEAGKLLYEATTTDLVLIPSSIHEWLIYPYEKDFDYYELLNTMVTQNEILKDQYEMLGEYPYIIRRDNLLKGECLFSLFEDLVVFEP